MRRYWILYDYLIHNNACLKGLLRELSDVKQMTEEYVEKLSEMSITLKIAEGIQTREHKGVYHLPSSTSQVGAIINLGTASKRLEVTIRSPHPDSKYPYFRVRHQNFFYDYF